MMTLMSLVSFFGFLLLSAWVYQQTEGSEGDWFGFTKLLAAAITFTVGCFISFCCYSAARKLKEKPLTASVNVPALLWWIAAVCLIGLAIFYALMRSYAKP